MTEIINNIMPVLSLVVSCVTLYTFINTRKVEAEERGKSQANLDNDIRQLKHMIEQMSKHIADQQQDTNRLKLSLELLLQQHNANHGQDIRRCT